MKALFHKISALTMALMLLLSTVSWTVAKHTCMGRVMDVALFAQAEDCGMKIALEYMAEANLENHCCEDESITLEGQDDLKASFSDFELEKQYSLYSFTFWHLELRQNDEQRAVSFELYPPPLLVKNIQLLDAVFLI